MTLKRTEIALTSTIEHCPLPGLGPKLDYATGCHLDGDERDSVFSIHRAIWA